MDVVAAYFERFNAEKLDEMADLFGSGYSYAEPFFPEPRDAAGHVALMRQIAQSYPNRQMRVRRRVPGASGEVVEAVWSGTRADSGITMTLDCLFAVDIDPKSGRISRMRGYYEPPPDIRPDSNRDSSSNQRQAAATGDSAAYDR